jgi:hypothetical protein
LHLEATHRQHHTEPDHSEITVRNYRFKRVKK